MINLYRDVTKKNATCTNAEKTINVQTEREKIFRKIKENIVEGIKEEDAHCLNYVVKEITMMIILFTRLDQVHLTENFSSKI